MKATLLNLPLLLVSTGGIVATTNAAPPRFEAAVVDANVEIGYGLAIGDVDGDGKQDIILADKREISWFRNPDWKEFSLARNLTLRDNVCVAAADLDGDGKVEIAVGAQWNPGETTKPEDSGAVFFLARPEQSDQPWTPVPLFHDPTTHRMRWIPDGKGGQTLVVLPLHGIGNIKGAGENFVNVRAYRVDPKKATESTAWTHQVLGAKLHVAHNFDDRDGILYLGGAEGIVEESIASGVSTPLITVENSSPPTRGVGEVRKGSDFLTAIEPFHGNDLVVYQKPEGKDTWERTLLTDTLNQGHALAVGDIDGDGNEDIIAGWRNPDTEGHVGIKAFLQQGERWEPLWVTNDLVATEDLKVVDLNGDGRLDIVAAGRSTGNLVIFWNRE
ncbi:MAG: VCBS repeat-containing protein [Verrucomicrobiales bacterium]|jgi:hypothetical protein|nr:VCBS repeat-containing protein [Verrucomicrobiales bacterium]